jgi:hypothetical protein
MNLKKNLAIVLTMAMIVGIITVPTFANEESTASFVHDGYTIDYSITETSDSQNIKITINNTGTESIKDWELVYDDFVGNITNIWDAIIVKNDSGLIIQDLMLEYNNDPMMTELFNEFKAEYISELEYIKNVGHNADIFPGESVTCRIHLDRCYRDSRLDWL